MKLERKQCTRKSTITYTVSVTLKTTPISYNKVLFYGLVFQQPPLHTNILCPRLGAEWIGRIPWLPRAPLGPIFMTGLYTPSKASCLLYRSGIRVIKIGPKGALGSHEIHPIHSAPSLGQRTDLYDRSIFRPKHRVVRTIVLVDLL